MVAQTLWLPQVLIAAGLIACMVISLYEPWKYSSIYIPLSWTLIYPLSTLGRIDSGIDICVVLLIGIRRDIPTHFILPNRMRTRCQTQPTPAEFYG